MTLSLSAVGYHIIFGFSWFIYLVIFITYSLLLFYGSYFVSSDFFIKVICAADTDNREIALSFDDGPAPSYTPEILELLNDHKIKAAFFCIGNRINGNETLLRRLHEDGHMIGNHSYSHHFWFDLFSTREMLADLKMMDQAMEKVTGLKPRLFRPPYGVTNPNLRKAIEQGNYIPVGWNIRSMDTVIKDEKKLLTKVTKALKPGAILLFHDTSKTTLAILPSFIKQVNEKGYKIVRLDKLLKLKAYV
ncbi:MAG: polysaccharide deacetylase family protein [Chitinophagaceae bacterium]